MFQLTNTDHTFIHESICFCLAVTLMFQNAGIAFMTHQTASYHMSGVLSFVFSDAWLKCRPLLCNILAGRIWRKLTGHFDWRFRIYLNSSSLLESNWWLENDSTDSDWRLESDDLWTMWETPSSSPSLPGVLSRWLGLYNSCWLVASFIETCIKTRFWLMSSVNEQSEPVSHMKLKSPHLSVSAHL